MRILYVYMLCAHVDKLELDKYTHALSFVWVRAWKLLSGACKAVFFSFSFSLSILSSLFSSKRGERKRERRGGRGREAVTRIIKQKTKTRIQLRVGHFLLNGGRWVWVVCGSLSVWYIYMYIRSRLCVCVCVLHIYISAPSLSHI